MDQPDVQTMAQLVNQTMAQLGDRTMALRADRMMVALANLMMDRLVSLMTVLPDDRTMVRLVFWRTGRTVGTILTNAAFVWRTAGQRATQRRFALRRARKPVEKFTDATRFFPKCP